MHSVRKECAKLLTGAPQTRRFAAMCKSGFGQSSGPRHSRDKARSMGVQRAVLKSPCTNWEFRRQTSPGIFWIGILHLVLVAGVAANAALVTYSEYRGSPVTNQSEDQVENECSTYGLYGLLGERCMHKVRPPDAHYNLLHSFCICIEWHRTVKYMLYSKLVILITIPECNEEKNRFPMLYRSLRALVCYAIRWQTVGIILLSLLTCVYVHLLCLCHLIFTSCDSVVRVRFPPVTFFLMSCHILSNVVFVGQSIERLYI